jgi:hypothetical protein
MEFGGALRSMLEVHASPLLAVDEFNRRACLALVMGELVGGGKRKT